MQLPTQIAAIKGLFREMRASAIDEGERLISREQALENAFRDRTVTEENLRTLLAAIEASRSRLRYIHLAAQLRTPDILKEDQIDSYNALRGYGADPCKEVPEGHDPVMWRRYSGRE